MIVARPRTRTSAPNAKAPVSKTPNIAATNAEAPPPRSSIVNGENPSSSNRFIALQKSERHVHEDITSPYFLSNGDHPGLVLAFPPLTDKNFQAWRRDFKISIGAKNKIAFLTRALPQPRPDDLLLNYWLRCNQMVMSWILHSISQEIKSSIMYLDSAIAIWSELNHRFDQGNGPRIFKMDETLITLHQRHDSVSAYFTKLKAIWDEIAELRPVPPKPVQLRLILLLFTIKIKFYNF
ncbi:uncharacterized protein LOC133791433 [Humulus lupulus]|uniref:uncharacterized protein LOC133791433 n=1 Tax=Humulus lupulus TaxID=3486 RepID=UPI002B40ED76|nr:uncharacterized protein LOC133791433 [Humulus lupulus]